jgi:hypothetical protein
VAPGDNREQRIAQSAVELDEVASAVVFVLMPGATGLQLSAAAGVEGPALDRLVAAVADPAHPITRTAAEAVATYDVAPMAPGGPALRSHLPLVDHRDEQVTVTGVLAVAHDHRLSPEARQVLDGLARRPTSD